MKKMKKKSEIVPTFILKGVAHKNIIQKYKNGDYLIDNEIRKQISNGEINKLPCLTKPSSENKEDGIFTEKFRNSPSIVFVTSNQKKVNYFKEHLETPTNGRCDNPSCKKDIIGNSMGYPIKYARKEKIIKDVVYIIHVFCVKGEFCNYCCAMDFLYEYKDSEFVKKDPNSVDSLILLRTMYSINYPEMPPLSRKNELCIMEENGGTVCKADFDKFTFRKTPNIVTIPETDQYYKI